MAIAKAKQESIEAIEKALGQKFGDLGRLSIASLKALAAGIEKLMNSTTERNVEAEPDSTLASVVTPEEVAEYVAQNPGGQPLEQANHLPDPTSNGGGIDNPNIS